MKINFSGLRPDSLSRLFGVTTGSKLHSGLIATLKLSFSLGALYFLRQSPHLEGIAGMKT